MDLTADHTGRRVDAGCRVDPLFVREVKHARLNVVREGIGCVREADKHWRQERRVCRNVNIGGRITEDKIARRHIQWVRFASGDVHSGESLFGQRWNRGGESCGPREEEIERAAVAAAGNG